LNNLTNQLDQAKSKISQLEKSNHETSLQLQEKLDGLRLTNQINLDGVFDAILMNCKAKVNESLTNLDDPNNLGNQSATVEHVLNLGEKFQSNANDFYESMLKKNEEEDMINNPAVFMSSSNNLNSLNTSSNHSLISSIQNATNMSSTFDQFLNNAKGIYRFATTEKDQDEVQSSIQILGHVLDGIYTKCTSTELKGRTDKAKFLKDIMKEVQDASNAVMATVEKFKSKSAPVEEGSIDQVMMNASQAIVSAMKKIEDLMKAPINPQISVNQRTVHEAILDATMAIMNAINNLMQCATAAQHEIVAHGKGAGSNATFYKKNSRWTEGLISAAKAVAISTNILVDAADGVVHGTKSMEQLIVASNEVAESFPIVSCFPLCIQILYNF
jgi:hypothetical protein